MFFTVSRANALSGPLPLPELCSLVRASSESRLHIPTLYASALKQMEQALQADQLGSLAEQYTPYAEETLALCETFDIASVRIAVPLHSRSSEPDCNLLILSLSLSFQDSQTCALHSSYDIAFRGRAIILSSFSADASYQSLHHPTRKSHHTLYPNSLHCGHCVTYGLHRRVCRDVDAAGHQSSATR